MSNFVALAFLTFFVAAIYSSVGHGGASGYLAVLSFFAISHEAMAASALCLNLLVAGLAFWIYFKAGHFNWNLTWPFVIASIPAALLGGFMTIPPRVYAGLLAAALSFAAFRLIWNIDKNGAFAVAGAPSPKVTVPAGGLLGILSGMVGVGGGIFLSPILILFRWADPKTTAATSAFFIWVNSMSGLFGRFLRGGFEFTPVLSLMVAAAFFGGLFGSRLGARFLSGLWLRRILGLVLFLAVFKLIRL